MLTLILDRFKSLYSRLDATRAMLAMDRDIDEVVIARNLALQRKLAYREDQERDDHGRWTDEGGGGTGVEEGGSGQPPPTPLRAPGSTFFKEAKPQEFIAARDKSKFQQFLSDISPEDLQDHELYLAHGGTVGYALDPKGDLQNVFNNGGPPGAGQEAVIDAVRHGAMTLDCFDPRLPEFYSKFGFVATGRIPFNDAYAPKGWDYAKYGRPDVVFMAYKGGNRDTISKRVGKFPKYPLDSGRRYTDYDQAKNDSRLQAVD